MTADKKSRVQRLVPLLLAWFAANARDLPWRRTRDPYAIWVSEIMLQQTQVKTVIPFWNRWMDELPTIEAAARAPSAKIHKLWEGLGYYTRVRNLQKAAQQIVAQHRSGVSAERRKLAEIKKCGVLPKAATFPKIFNDVLALPGIGRYTAGAICSIAFNQPVPILDGNVIRVLTRIFGIAENPKEKATNARLWQLAEELVTHADKVAQASRLHRQAGSPPHFKKACSHLNQSLMELGALVCTPRNAQCSICPVKKLCIAFKENRVETLPNLGKRETATARHFTAFVIERNGRFLVRQRPAGIVNGHLWEFPNVETGTTTGRARHSVRAAARLFENGAQRTDAPYHIKDLQAADIKPLCTVKHSITRYRITLKAFHVNLGGMSSTNPHSKSPESGTREIHPFEKIGVWKTPSQMRQLAFTSAHRKVLHVLIANMGG